MAQLATRPNWARVLPYDGQDKVNSPASSVGATCFAQLLELGMLTSAVATMEMSGASQALLGPLGPRLQA
jgi:hypothetical protein